MARCKTPTPPKPQPAPQPDLAGTPVADRHAAGIDVGKTTHWACVASAPDATGTVREFPAHTPGLRELVAWLRHCGVTTVALEASGPTATCCTSRSSRPGSTSS